MSKQGFAAACLICACTRHAPTTQDSGAERTTPHLEPRGAVARVVERGTAPSAASATPSPTVDGGAPAASLASAGVPSGPRGSRRSWGGNGYTKRLRLDANTLTYCDDRGSRAVDLTSGVERAHDGACPNALEERNRDCGGIDFISEVREPGPDDIIDLTNGTSIPVQGFIHDCAFNRGILLIATGMQVVAIDVKANRQVVKGKDGGDQVALNETWLAWAEGKNVFAERR